MNINSENEGLVLEDYKKIKQVGSGSFGIVYQVLHEKSNSYFAWKEIRYNILTLIPLLTATLKEIKVLKEINHCRLVDYHGAKMTQDSFVIIMEYMDGGSVRDKIVAEGALNEKQAAFYSKAVLEGLQYLHHNGIIHRDVKCGHILLNSLKEVKLTDFRLSATEIQNQTYCGTSYFMSPELIQKKPYNSSVDIWALGVTVVEMMTKFPIYFRLGEQGLYTNLVNLNTEVEYEIQKPSEHLKYFLQMAFRKIPDERPSASDLLQSKFILTSPRF